MARSSFGKAKTGPIRTTLTSIEFNAASVAGSANAILSPVTFASTNFPEIADYTQIYDECRMLKMRLHYYPIVSTAGGSPTVSCAFALGFDPSIGTYSAPNQVLEEAFSQGPFRLHAGINGATVQSGDMLHPYRVLHAHPPVKLAPITSADVPGSAWFCVDGGTAPTLAMVQGYINSLGGAGVTSFYYFLEIDVEFRLRT